MFLFRWLWKNMKGCRAIYILALCITVVCQSMYIITPYFTQQITDTFIVNENALQNLEEHTDVLIFMLAAMVGFTLLRCGLQYGSNMMYVAGPDLSRQESAFRQDRKSGRGVL